MGFGVVGWEGAGDCMRERGKQGKKDALNILKPLSTLANIYGGDQTHSCATCKVLIERISFGFDLCEFRASTFLLLIIIFSLGF